MLIPEYSLYINNVKAKSQTTSPIIDQFSRTISYLRLSLTDRCNLRCIYCMPERGSEKDNQVKTGRFLRHDDLLTYEELLRLVRITVSLGMSKIRLTGGEPLVRKGIVHFIEQLYRLQGLHEVRLTTNGVLLPEFAEQLFDVGVRHLNISLDTLQKDKFFQITGRDYFEKVWQGISIAEQLGFKIKLNVVAIKGINDDEFADFAMLAANHPFQVRFIEFMPVGEKSIWQQEKFISSDEIREIVSTVGSLVPRTSSNSDGPARIHVLQTPDGKDGEIGFISPISHHFCSNCNRLRLTSDGSLRACLLSDKETSLKTLIRNGASDGELIDCIRHTIAEKPQGHNLEYTYTDQNLQGCLGRMSRIGG